EPERKENCNDCAKKEACAKKFRFIKWTIRLLLIGALLSTLILFTLEVINDLPSVRNENDQIFEFPAPVISMQLRLNFTIACDFLLFDIYDQNHPFNNCSEYLTQPQLNSSIGQYTGKFDPKDRTFPSNQTSYQLKRILFKFNILNDSIVEGDLPAFTINIFDSVNKTMADEMYNESAKNTYFQQSTPFITSSFRTNRYFLGRNITYHIRMTRRITNLIIPSFWDNFGLPLKHDTKAYITQSF
ncbi:5353_t:CDS:2, partial [Gigaspora rosea]